MEKPKLRPGVIYRQFVNIIFWALVMWALSLAAGHSFHVPLVANENARVLGVDKILEVADGDVWFFQFIAGLTALGLMRLEKRFAPKQQKVFNRLTKDDFYAIFLNFGTLFILSGGYRLTHHMPNGLSNLVLGFLNATFYCFCSNFNISDFERPDEPSKSVKLAHPITDRFNFSSFGSPREFISKKYFNC